MTKAQSIRKRKCRLKKRLKSAVKYNGESKPALGTQPAQYELSERVQAIGIGGIGIVNNLLRKLQLPKILNERLSLLKVHQPYTESDHILNIAYNSLLGGTGLNDIELRRMDEVYLNALGVEAIPDPTTAGDFCRRNTTASINAMMDAVNRARLKVWAKQPKAFFDCARIDADGTSVETLGETKEGMDINYKGQWGYSPLLISLANTQEPLFIQNRPGNRPSQEGAAGYLDKAGELCEKAGFREILLRGDTAFTQTAYLDGWHDRGWKFTFGMKGFKAVVAEASALKAKRWKRLRRPKKDETVTKTRSKSLNIKEAIIEKREYRNITLEKEDVACIEWKPENCTRSYRVVILRKTLQVSKGHTLLFPDHKYFFYITNDRQATLAEIIRSANQRCNQENLIAQLKSIRALHAPVNSLNANWAYMVMSSLAWSIKAWLALLLPAQGRWKEKHRKQKQRLLTMEVKAFLDRLIRVPCQVIRKGRQIIYRILSSPPDLDIFLRLEKTIAELPRLE